MSYSVAPHFSALFPVPTGSAAGAAHGNPATAVRSFALLDVGQFIPVERRLQRLLSQWPGDMLFEESSGAEALEYSPRLIELHEDLDAAREQAASLDAACAHLPALSILRGRVTREELLQRLRFFMWVEADRTSYLLRLADTQSLQAVVAVLTAAQRARLFAGLQAWWCVDYEGRLIDLAEGGVRRQEGPVEQPGSEALFPRFELDATQTSGVMRGTEVPMFAAQIRHFESEFDRRLSHAEQAKFASDFLAEARLEAYEDDDMLPLARARWQAMQSQGQADA